MTGAEYLAVISMSQNACEQLTLAKLPSVDPKLPTAMDRLGDALMLLEQFATCSWGCRRDDHLTERFAARANSYALAAVRLLWFGHYDEAYSLLRTIGELANLLLLFASEPRELEAWRAADEVARRNHFGAGAVRQKLAAHDLPQVLNRDRFNVLSARFAHSGQIPVAQLHNVSGIQTTGGRLQPGGLLYGFALLTVFVATISLAVAELADAPDDRHALLRQAGDDLMTVLE